MKQRILRGDSITVLRTLRASSADALVTDPPAGIAFMGKRWDEDKGGRKQWIAWLASIMGECLRVLKPGAHGLVWALPRTSHWTATALEDAGFEIRDVGVHLFGTGFPKSRSLLKPAAEHWILVRAPGELRELGIDACRIGTNGGCRGAGPGPKGAVYGDGLNGAFAPPVPGLGRWPANLTLDKEAAALLDEQSGDRPGGNFPQQRTPNAVYGGGRGTSLAQAGGPRSMDDSGGASRFFYCAKASRKDRGDGNTHPTVKHTNLMRWLCRLITPPRGLVLDPFAGSGSTGVACARESFRFIGIEREAEYAAIARRRLRAA